MVKNIMVITKFKNKYIDFKFFHKSKLNILIHFLTTIIQLYLIYKIYINIFSWGSTFYFLLLFVIPFITDAIGHLTERNFGVVLIATKLRKSTNSAGSTYLENFLFKIILFIETFLFIKILR